MITLLFLLLVSLNGIDVKNTLFFIQLDELTFDLFLILLII
jgi:hypothetical protein